MIITLLKYTYFEVLIKLQINGSQFIIVTYSPILLGIPNADTYIHLMMALYILVLMKKPTLIKL